MPNVLVVNASAAEATVVAEALAVAGHTARHVTSEDAALALLEAEHFDLVVSASARASDEASLVEQLAVRWPGLPIVTVAGGDADTNAAQALQAGAADFLTTPIAREEVAFVVAKVLSAVAATATKPPWIPSRGATMLGETEAMRTLRDLVRRTASGTATALVRGETGTGKELVARAVHAQSPRKDQPFVKIDCASLPDTLLESELFGYEKGAFTGAVTRKPGRVELAEGGTLFLDEIGEVSAALQAKLLRLLQDREFERLGSRKTQRIDVRFVLATHRDLETMVENGTFRQDLFYRLNVVALWTPPLRARREDIELLAREFCARFAAANGKPGIALSPSAIRLLRTQRWPGNVRQLENFIEKLVVLSDGPTIEAADIERELVQKPDFRTQQTDTLGSSTEVDLGAAPRALADAVRRAEKIEILGALKHTSGNRAVAARVLGISRATLYNKLRELGLDER